MVQINFAQRTVNAKIVYYGPGMSGKTTNLEVIHQRAPSGNRGDLTSISTDGDRTLFFDFMPLDLGTVAGMRTCFQIYTVPGQVYYNSTRKLVLQGVDGVVFVADSSASMQDENLESMKNLLENLAEYGRSLEELPLVIQYNKRDLPDAMSVEELDALLNPYGVPSYEGVANTGQGVFPTLKALAACVIEHIHKVQQAGSDGGSTSHEPPPRLQQTGFHAPPVPTTASAHAAHSEAQYAPEPAAPFAGHSAPAPAKSLELAASAPQPTRAAKPTQPARPAAQQQHAPAPPAHAAPAAAAGGGDLRLTRPMGAQQGGPARNVAKPPVTPQRAPGAQPGAAARPAAARAPQAVAPQRQQARPSHLMQPEPAAPPAAKARARSFPVPAANAAPAQGQVRSTPMQAPAGKKNVMVTALIVAGSVIVGAVIGSVVLSLL